MPRVLCLSYVSRSRLPGDPQSFSLHIRRIVETSRKWNSLHDITSALTYSAGYFVRILEGEPVAVRNTYGHICCNPLNSDHRLLQLRHCSVRKFDGLPMAFNDGSGRGEIPHACPSQLVEPSIGFRLLAMLRSTVQEDIGRSAPATD